MKSVGMNPSEQELVDMTNEVRRVVWDTDHNFLYKVEKKGVIYFEDVCKLILRKFREEDEEEFIKIMFKVKSHQIKKKVVGEGLKKQKTSS